VIDPGGKTGDNQGHEIAVRRVGARPHASLPHWGAAPDWFPRADLMTIGVYYYPKPGRRAMGAGHGQHAQARHGVRPHGQFAWAFLEPEEGKYQFDWLEKNVALAAQNGMK